MNAILRRSTEMITPEAWAELDAQAKRVLSMSLAGRKFVDIVGPKGWDYAGHPLGRLDIRTAAPVNGVEFGVNRVLPLVEARSVFELDQWELDNISRGSKNPDIKPLEDAAKAIAAFEDRAIFSGLDEGCIVGLKGAASHNPVTLDGGAEGILRGIAGAVLTLQDASVEGPYVLVASPALWKTLYTTAEDYPLIKRVEKLVSKVVFSNASETSFLVSERGGDMELVIGQDMSLGYEDKTTGKVRCFLTESFTFRVVNPEAVVPINA